MAYGRSLSANTVNYNNSNQSTRSSYFRRFSRQSAIHVQQPLLAGRAPISIASPAHRQQHSGCVGLNQGVVIARINTDISLWISKSRSAHDQDVEDLIGIVLA